MYLLPHPGQSISTSQIHKERSVMQVQDADRLERQADRKGD